MTVDSGALTEYVWPQMLRETSEGAKHFVLYRSNTDRTSPFLKVENL